MAGTRRTSKQARPACEVSCRARRGFAVAVAIRPRDDGSPVLREEVRPDPTLPAPPATPMAPSSGCRPLPRPRPRGSAPDRWFMHLTHEISRLHAQPCPGIDGIGEWPRSLMAILMSRMHAGRRGRTRRGTARRCRAVRSRSIGGSIPVRADTRTCGDVWFRQGLAIGEREPRTPLGLVNHVAKRSTWQPPVDSRSRCLGSRVSVEAASASRAVEASCSGAAIRTSVT